MNSYLEIGGVRYHASFAHNPRDFESDNRPTMFITLEMPYAQAAELFVEGAQWSIVNVIDEENEEVVDYSSYSIPGDILVHRDGTLLVKMSHLTAEELLAMFEEVL